MTNNITKLFGVKNMLVDHAKLYTAYKSSCRLSQSVTSPTPEYSLVSSAKLTSLDAHTSPLISEIIIKNRRVSKTDCAFFYMPSKSRHGPIFK